MNVRTFFALTLLFAPFVVFGQDASMQGQPVSVPELYVGGPVAPVIKEGVANDSWYPQRDLTFTWQLPSNVTAVAAELFDESGKEPIESFRPPVDSFTIPADQLTEGQHYLSVQFRNEEKWGMFSEISINVDATAPEPFAISFKPLSGVAGAIGVTFNTSDALSGISYYELFVGDETPRIVSPQDAISGTMVELPKDEVSTITVKAYDKAGNFATASTSIFGVASAGVTTHNSSSSALLNTDPVYFLVGLLAAMMLLMFGYMVFERQRYANNIEDIKIETDEVQDRLLRVFSALREEIYDQIDSISSKKRLSKGEKSAIDSLNQALAVSESLVEREIKDVKKLLD